MYPTLSHALSSCILDTMKWYGMAWYAYALSYQKCKQTHLYKYKTRRWKTGNKKTILTVTRGNTHIRTYWISAQRKKTYSKTQTPARCADALWFSENRMREERKKNILTQHSRTVTTLILSWAKKRQNFVRSSRKQSGLSVMVMERNTATKQVPTKKWGKKVKTKVIVGESDTYRWDLS